MVDESEAVPNIPLVPDEELDAMKIKISQIKNDIQREKVKGVEHSMPSTGSVSLLRQGADRSSIPRAAHGLAWGVMLKQTVQQRLVVELCYWWYPHALQPIVSHASAWLEWWCPVRRQKQKDPVVVPSSSSICMGLPVTAIPEHPCGGWGSYAVDTRRTRSVACQFLAVKVWSCKRFWSEVMYFWIFADSVMLLKLFLSFPVSKHQTYEEHHLCWLDSLTQIWCLWPRLLSACKTCFLRGVRLQTFLEPKREIRVWKLKACWCLEQDMNNITYTMRRLSPALQKNMLLPLCPGWLSERASWKK